MWRARPSGPGASPPLPRETTMTDLSQSQPMPMHGHHAGALERTFLIGLIAFLTVVDLFGTQAILPALARAYGVTPAAMGFAVNAATMGMASSIRPRDSSCMRPGPGLS